MWDADAEKWYISIVDVIEVLTESRTVARNARKEIESQTGKPVVSRLNAGSVKPLAGKSEE